MAGKDSIEVRFARAQAKFKPIPKRGLNPYFKSTGHPNGSPYCLYEDIMAECLPHLHAENLNLRHTSRFDAGLYLVGTAIYGEEGALPAFEMPIPIEGPQKQSAGITYAKRVTAAALLAASTDEDDDGNKASTADTNQNTTNHPSDYYDTKKGTPQASTSGPTATPPQREYQPSAGAEAAKVGKLITEGQRKRLFAIQSQCGWRETETKDIMSRAFGVTSTTALNMRDYDVLVNIIQTKTYAEAFEDVNFQNNSVPGGTSPTSGDFSLAEVPF